MSYVGVSEFANVYSDIVHVATAYVPLQFGSIYNIVMSEDPSSMLKARKENIEEMYLKGKRDDVPYPEGMWGIILAC